MHTHNKNLYIIFALFLALFISSCTNTEVNKTSDNNQIIWQPISKEELIIVENASSIKNSFIKYNLVKKYVNLFSSNHVFLLYFNIFQLSLIFKKPNFLFAFTIKCLLLYTKLNNNIDNYHQISMILIKKNTHYNT